VDHVDYHGDHAGTVNDGLPVWSTANASVMGNFEPPAGMTCGVIFADWDEVNKGGYRAGTRGADGVVCDADDAEMVNRIGFGLRGPRWQTAEAPREPLPH
jgi:hypothetical protein